MSYLKSIRCWNAIGMHVKVLEKFEINLRLGRLEIDHSMQILWMRYPILDVGILVFLTHRNL